MSLRACLHFLQPIHILIMRFCLFNWLAVVAHRNGHVPTAISNWATCSTITTKKLKPLVSFKPTCKKMSRLAPCLSERNMVSCPANINEQFVSIAAWVTQQQFICKTYSQDIFTKFNKKNSSTCEEGEGGASNFTVYISGPYEKKTTPLNRVGCVAFNDC